ncbi:MAG: polysaccharide biosynthesis tyrosine autokinase [Calothrix sp. MO_192.B10]|nr:polysaccharide biosynthesis tyrosine autokinase [Calothrix sp. MO_192.B10]
MPSNEEEQDAVDLRQYSHTLKKYWLVTATVMFSVFGLTALATFSQKKVYQAKGKLVLKQSETSSLTGLRQRVGELSGLTLASSPVDTGVEIISSNPMVKKTINKLELKDKYGQPLKIEDFLKNLKVKGIRGTDVMELTYRSTNAKEATDVINTLMKTYLENNILTNRTEAKSVKELLSKELPQIESRVVEAEVALRRFKDANRVVSLEEEARVGVEALQDLLSQINRAKAQLEGVKNRSAALQSKLKLTTQQAVKLSTLSQSPGVQQVVTEYQKVQDELAVARTRLTDENPIVKNLIGKEQALRKQIEKRVGGIVGSGQSIPEQNLQIGQLKQTLTEELVKSEIDRLALANQVGVLQKAFLSSQARLRMLPQLEQRQQALERRLQVAKTTYQQAFKQLQEVEVLEKQKIGNVRIVSQALTPEKPISPKIALNLVLGGFLGILLGIGTALLLEAMDKSLKTVKEVKRLLDYPLLGAIPHLSLSHKGKSSLEIPIRDKPDSSASAAFEMLMTNLDFTLSDKELRVILVTSSVPNEGKSFVAANLATAKAQMGQRVLLIDADMRRPRQQEIWGLPNLTGLSQVLAGKGDLQTTPQQAFMNLDVLTSGAIPPHPLALMNSQPMATLIESAGTKYDFVIIDTSPVTLSAEAQVLGKWVDGMLLVVRPGVVDVDAVTATKSLVEHSGHRVLGMVVNGQIANSDYSYYPGKVNYEHQVNEKTQIKLPTIRVS